MAHELKNGSACARHHCQASVPYGLVSCPDVHAGGGGGGGGGGVDVWARDYVWARVGARAGPWECPSTVHVHKRVAGYARLVSEQHNISEPVMARNQWISSNPARADWASSCLSFHDDTNSTTTVCCIHYAL